VVNDDLREVVGRLVELVTGAPASGDSRADPGSPAPSAQAPTSSSGVTE
jgi:hypothetical protein